MVDRRTQRNPRQVQRQRQFLEELENQGFRYKVGGLRALPGCSSHRGLGGSQEGVWGGCLWPHARVGGDRLLALDEGGGSQGGAEGPTLPPTLRQWRTRRRSSSGSELTIACLTGTGDLRRPRTLSPEGSCPGQLPSEPPIGERLAHGRARWTPAHLHGGPDRQQGSQVWSWGRGHRGQPSVPYLPCL